MFRWFTRSQQRTVGNAPRRTRLWLEQLERRDCPTGPSMNLAATVLSGHLVRLTGTVSDNSPNTVQITFSGAMSGTTSPDLGGNFSYTASATGLGTVSAQGVDSQNLTTNTCQVQLTKPAPSVSLAISYGQQKTVTLSGSVSDLDASSLSVTFGGQASGSAAVAPDGTFSYTTTAAALGTITASTVDLWGQASNQAQVTAARSAPVISNFIGTQGINGWWTFSGKVTVPSPTGLVVSFTGPAGVNNESTTVNGDGSFTLTVQVAAGAYGLVSAQTIDWWGQNSNVASIYISQGGGNGS